MRDRETEMETEMETERNQTLRPLGYAIQMHAANFLISLLAFGENDVEGFS